MAVQVLNPDETFVTDNGRIIGPVKIADDLIGPAFETREEILRQVQFRRADDDAASVAQACLDAFDDFLFKCGFH